MLLLATPLGLKPLVLRTRPPKQWTPPGSSHRAPEQPGQLRPPQPPPPQRSEQAVDRLIVLATARPVRLVADPTVATATVEGPHTVYREGGVMRIEGPNGSGGYQVDRKVGLARWLSQASSMGTPMVVRMNPELPVEVEVMAGSLDVYGLRAPLTFTVVAGSLKADDCSGPFTGNVQAGSAKLETRLLRGESTLRVASGSVDVRLLDGSDVRVVARSELGEVKIKNADGVAKGSGSGEVTVGAGTASLRIDVSMGSAKVRVP